MTNDPQSVRPEPEPEREYEAPAVEDLRQDNPLATASGFNSQVK